MKPLSELLGLSAERKALLLRMYREHIVHRRGTYLLAAACMAVVAGTTAASAWLMKDVVNEIFVSRNADMLWFISTLVAAVFLVKGTAEYASRIILSRIGNSITAALRKAFFSHLLRQDLRFFLNASSSDFVARLVNQINAVRTTAELLITGAIRDLFSLIGLVLVMVLQQPLLFCIAIPSAWAIIWFLGRLGSRLGHVVRAEHHADVMLIGTVQETTRGIRSVKAFGLGDMLQRRFGDVIRQSERRANHIDGITALSLPLTETMGGLAIAGIILFSGWHAIASDKPPGEFMAFITALLLAYEPAKRLSHLKLQLERQLVLVESFYQFMDRKTQIVDPQAALPLNSRQPAPIRFQDVDFRYAEDTPLVLHGLNLNLQPGVITALCGPTGSGKSTLIDLLLRFHDPVTGSISIAGRDLKQLSQASINSFFSYVGQDAFLFDASIGDNIRLGSENVGHEQIADVTRAAVLDGFVATLPQGFDTLVGEQGVRLSGGQRQRIAIARALLKQSPTLVLDEATSALDPVTERKILLNIRHRQPDSSLLIVSHRIAPLAIADHILVLNEGVLVEQGSYQALTSPGSRFHEIFASQLGAGTQLPKGKPPQAVRQPA